MGTFDIIFVNGIASTVSVSDEGPNYGREGAVLLTSDRASCVKCFRQDGSINLTRKMNKIHLMLTPRFDDFRTPSNRSADAATLGGFGWPTFAAFDPSLRNRNNPQGFVGYGMSYLADTETLSRLHVGSNELSQDAGLGDRLRISAIISFLFALAHGRQMCIGDARPENIRIRRTGPGQWQAFIIDTDSFQLAKPGAGKRRYFTSDGGHDEYSSPRLLRQVLERTQTGYRDLKRIAEDDLHALAVINFQNLFGHHPLRTTGKGRAIHQNALDNIFPYAGGPIAPNRNAPTARYAALPAEVRALFEDAFLRERYAPARQWMEVFDRLSKVVPDLVPPQEAARPSPKAAPPTTPSPTAPSPPSPPPVTDFAKLRTQIDERRIRRRNGLIILLLLAAICVALFIWLIKSF